MPTDTRTSELVLNVLSKQDYDNIPNPDPNQLYLVPEDEKANVDANNFTDAGTTYLSKIGFCSSRYETITIGTSGTQYTAPANGWFYVYISSVSSSNIQTIYMENMGKACTSNTANTGINALACTLPFISGDKLRLFWSKASSASMTFRFYYAEGNPTPSNP